MCSIQYINGVPSFTAKNLKAIPLFSEFDDEDEQESTVSVRAITPTVFLGLKLKELIKFIKEVPDFRDTFEKAVDKQLCLCISCRCPLYVRYLSAFIPYIYRTSTVQVPDMNWRYCLVICLFHWGSIIDILEIFT